MNKGKPLSSVIAGNVLINLVGQLVPPVVAVITMPLIVGGLGVARYGVLSIIWVILGYSAMLELGLSRALTKFVAEYLGRREEDKIPQAVWTTLSFQTLLGVVAGAVLVILTPVIIRALKIPSDLIPETRMSLYLMAVLPPLIFSSSSLMGLLMAGQRFGLVNSVQVLSTTFNYSAIAVCAYLLHWGLSRVVIVMVIVKALTCLAYLVMCLRAFPVLRLRPSLKLKAIHPFFTFGGWVAMAGTLGYVITYIDRFLISNLMSIAWVAFYSVPFDVLNRLWIIPSSLVTTLFPAFSTLMTDWQSNRERIEQVYSRSLKYLLLALAPVVIVLFVFARDILRLWMGDEFAQKSTGTFQLLAIGWLLASLAWIPFTLLQSIGRPDLPAKFLLLESVVHFVMAWMLIRAWGIPGAALAWLIRSSIDVLLHFGAVKALRLVPTKALWESGLVRTLVMTSTLTGAMLVLLLGGSLSTRIAVAVLLNLIFIAVAWRYSLDTLDKRPVTLAFNRFFSLNTATAR
jgi:O-antigen/teichoic acid export membrane protein